MQGGATDPTKQFLARLADESQWSVRRGVPVFEPHTRTVAGPDGKPRELEVTAADMPAIAAECRRLEQEKGVVGLLTDRHTIRWDAQKGQMVPVPEARTYGYQLNYRVGVYGPNNTPCVLADWHLYPDVAAEVDRRPHRSVEYQHGARLIRGTAIMVNAPFLDMGMVAFTGRDETYLYAMGASAMPLPTPDDKNANNVPDDKEKKGGDKPEGEQHTPEEIKLFEKCRTYMLSKYALDETWPAAGKKPDAPTDQPKPGDPPADKPKEPVTPMQSDKDIQAYDALKARVVGLEMERDIERCDALLAKGLVGYSLSDAEQKKELKKLVATPAADRPDRVKELKAIYADRKVPEGRIELYQGAKEGLENANPLVAEPWYHKDAVAYMLESQGKVGYDASVAHIKATRKQQ